MFQRQAHRSRLLAGLSILELIYHSTVRAVRKNHGSAVWGLVISVFQGAMMTLIFYGIMMLMGGRTPAIRGDYLLYIMSGVFVYMTHTKVMGRVAAAGAATSAMTLHGPMTTAVAIAAAALSSLYLQVMSMGALLFLYHALINRISFEFPVQAMGMLILSWAYGVAVGLVLLAARPWAPRPVSILQAIYARVNLFASGKMFVANALSFSMLKFFDWNPLFHIIDQMRGFVFLNYSPHHTSVTYPAAVMLAVLMVGLMGEFYTRKHASASWSARN